MELKLRHIFISIILLLFISVNISGQEQLLNTGIKRDSLLAVNMNMSAEKYLNQNRYDTALIFLNDALTISVEKGFAVLEADSYFLYGIYYSNIDKWDLSLRYFFMAAAKYSANGQSAKQAEVYSRIAGRYYDLSVFSKSAEYYIKECSLYKHVFNTKRFYAAFGSAASFFQLDTFRQAIIWYDSCLFIAEHISDTSLIIKSLFGLSGSYIKIDEFDMAGRNLGLLTKILEIKNDTKGLAEVYNSLGHIEFRKNNYDRAIEYYLLSADLLKESKQGAHTAYANIAIAYQNTENREQAEYYFEEALSEARKAGDRSERARLEHILAVLHHNNDDLYHAGFYCNAGINSAKTSKNYYVLRDCYLSYSKVLEDGNDFVNALAYYEKYLSLNDSLLLEKRLDDQEEERIRAYYENIEQQLLLRLADEEVKDITIEKLRVEKEKSENEKKLFKSEIELQISEAERLKQLSALREEKYNREMNEREIRALEQERVIQDLRLERQKEEEINLLNKNRVQKLEIDHQQLEIEKEHEKRMQAISMVILSIIIAIITLISFFNSRRKNIILSAQKKEIESNKEVIEEKNLAITDSIEYAKRIQTAVLAPVNFLDEWGFDNYIFFRPKDIVSGDFYWGQRKDDLYCFAAADCTGHGVPGAFMSMLGNAYLNDIVNSRDFKDAADILNQLRVDVMKSLKQRGEEGEAQDGLDIALCLYDKKENILNFAGANNPLYHIRDNQLHRIDADKMPIGIHRSLDKSFTNHSIIPEDGDRIYLFSDGYADQFGGIDGKKFKYKAFRDLLLVNHKKPMHEQRKILEGTFEDWKGDVEQVDDVLVIGLNFQLKGAK